MLSKSKFRLLIIAISLSMWAGSLPFMVFFFQTTPQTPPKDIFDNPPETLEKFHPWFREKLTSYLNQNNEIDPPFSWEDTSHDYQDYLSSLKQTFSATISKVFDSVNPKLTILKLSFQYDNPTQDISFTIKDSFADSIIFSDFSIHLKLTLGKRTLHWPLEIKSKLQFYSSQDKFFAQVFSYFKKQLPKGKDNYLEVNEENWDPQKQHSKEWIQNHLPLFETKLKSLKMVSSFQELWDDTLQNWNPKDNALSLNKYISHQPQSLTISDSDAQKLTNLESLNLSLSNLYSISGLEKLTKLTHLTLSDNNLSSLPGLEKLTSLESLDLSRNNLDGIFNLPALTHLFDLNLSHNKLKSLPGLEHLINLTYLDLSSNNLSSLPTFLYLPKLWTLDLSSNNLSSLPGLEKLTKLTHLYLSNNPITKIYLHTKYSPNPDAPDHGNGKHPINLDAFSGRTSIIEYIGPNKYLPITDTNLDLTFSLNAVTGTIWVQWPHDGDHWKYLNDSHSEFIDKLWPHLSYTSHVKIHFEEFTYTPLTQVGGYTPITNIKWKSQTLDNTPEPNPNPNPPKDPSHKTPQINPFGTLGFYNILSSKITEATTNPGIVDLQITSLKYLITFKTSLTGDKSFTKEYKLDNLDLWFSMSEKLLKKFLKDLFTPHSSFS